MSRPKTEGPFYPRLKSRKGTSDGLGTRPVGAKSGRESRGTTPKYELVGTRATGAVCVEILAKVVAQARCGAGFRHNEKCQHLHEGDRGEGGKTNEGLKPTRGPKEK